MQVLVQVQVQEGLCSSVGLSGSKALSSDVSQERSVITHNPSRTAAAHRSLNTVHCSAGRETRTHRIPLINSLYLQELFLEVGVKRAVVVLPGVRVQQLRVILQFIYTGEVSVTEAGLAELLEVAEMLGVRGLGTSAQTGVEDSGTENETSAR